jgi:hypothetical protein
LKAGAGAETFFLKAGAGAGTETNSFGSATLVFSSKLYTGLISNHAWSVHILYFSFLVANFILVSWVIAHYSQQNLLLCEDFI